MITAQFVIMTNVVLKENIALYNPIKLLKNMIPEKATITAYLTQKVFATPNP